MTLFIRLLREFWIAFLAALLWTLYRLHVSTEGDVISTVIAAFAPAFFLVSWGTGQFVRVKRQQAIEDALQAVAKGMNDILNAAEKLLLITKDIPGFNATVQEIVATMKTANTQMAAANSAISALPTMAWASDWPVPQRPRPNPAIYGSMVTATPLPLKDAARKQGDDKGT